MTGTKKLTPRSKVLLDTNIMVYASDIDSDYNRVCLKLLKHDYNFHISDRCLLELYRVLTGPKKLTPDQALEIINYYQNNPKFTIVLDTQSSSSITFELAQITQAISGRIFDLNILAIAIDHEIEYIITRNSKDYPQQQAVKIVDPNEIF